MNDSEANSSRKRNFRLRLNEKNIPDEELLADLRRVATLSSKGKLSIPDYKNRGKYWDTTIARRFGSWNNALRKAGLPINIEIGVSDIRLFENLERVWVALGRQPCQRDMTKPLSEFSSSPYTRRFNSWNKALQSFIDYVNEGADVGEEVLDQQIITDTNKTGRDINLRLRFRVMQRDRFTCKSCGRSPATHTQVVLHVDHMVPWSKGGKTVIENLQTLCSDCNLGKGNL
jgi:hypothetical protein